MGRAAKGDEVQTKTQDVATVKVSDLRDFYNQAHSPAEVAEEFNVEEADVMRVLGLYEQGEDLDEFNQPRVKPEAEEPQGE